jgi:hypothetical protein
MKPYSIRIFLPDGVPDGLRLVEKSNWSGLGIVCPRSLLGESKSRAEFARTGVYVLVGESETSGLPTVYVGESDSIRPRLEQHASKKDFWTAVTFFVSKDDNLNKAHVQYLESRLVGLASEAKRCVLDNGNVPAPPSLSEADRADAEGFLDEMLLCFPIVGLDVFDQPAAPASGATRLYLVGDMTEAEGYEVGGEFVVCAGSKGRLKDTASFHQSLRQKRLGLIDQQVLQVEGEQYVFVQDYAFQSPSTAAAVTLGRNANGRVEWKDGAGRTLKTLQEGDG